MSCGWCGHGHCSHCGYGHCPYCGYGHCHHGGYGYGPPPEWGGYGPGYGPRRRRGRRQEGDLAAYLEDLEEEVARVREELARIRRSGAAEE